MFSSIRQQSEEPDFPSVRLEGFRVVLRPPCLDDYQQWALVRSQNKNFLQPYEPTWPTEALDQDFFERRLKRQIRDWKNDRAYAFLVFLKSQETLIGGINVNNVCRGAAQFGSIGYWLDETMQGNGYMSETLRIVLNYCFSDLRLHRVNASCLPHNTPSIKLLKRLGFAEEGFASRYLQINGVWEDHVLFGRTKEDWECVV